MHRKIFLADIRAANDPEELKKVIAGVANAFGFDEFVYASWSSNWRNYSTPDTIRSCDNSSTRRFEECVAARAEDSFVAEAMDTILPIHWNHKTDRFSGPLTKEFARQGFREVWAKSERDSHNNRGLVCFLRSRAAVDRPEMQHEDELVWMSYLIHLHGGEIFAPKRQANLTKVLSEREREVLRWTGEGKTSEEISSILAISKNTVNFHVKNAAQKLGCVNKTASVVTAMTLGLL